MKKNLSDSNPIDSLSKHYPSGSATRKTLPTVEHLRSHQYCSNAVCSVLEITLKEYTGTQQRLATDALSIAIQKYEKLDRATDFNKSTKTAVLVSCLDHASIQTDVFLRELWGNVIANELHLSSVHPECTKLLSRLTHADIFTLLNTASGQGKEHFQIMGDAIKMNIRKDNDASIDVDEISPLSCEILASLGIIKRELGEWELSLLGEELLKAITEPAVVNAVKENQQVDNN